MGFGWGCAGSGGCAEAGAREHTGTVSTETGSMVTVGKDRGEVTGRFTGGSLQVLPDMFVEDTKREHSTGEKPGERKTDFLVPIKK
jgi:hypothetical protein